MCATWLDRYQRSHSNVNLIVLKGHMYHFIVNRLYRNSYCMVTLGRAPIDENLPSVKRTWASRLCESLCWICVPDTVNKSKKQKGNITVIIIISGNDEEARPADGFLSFVFRVCFILFVICCCWFFFTWLTDSLKRIGTKVACVPGAWETTVFYIIIIMLFNGVDDGIETSLGGCFCVWWGGCGLVHQTRLVLNINFDCHDSSLK